MNHQQLFHNLVQLAAVDGKFTDEEVEFLVERAERWNIPSEEFETALASLQNHEIELKMPADRADRVEMLRQMIMLMAVDGELAETEKRLCATASASMEISGDEFTSIVDSLLGN